MKKYFVPNYFDDCFCYPISSIKDKMRYMGIKQVEAFEAEKSKDKYFFCLLNSACGEVGECGRCCADYLQKKRN